MADAEKIEISNLEELKAFRDAVNAGESYKGKTVVLTADIDLKNEEWTPIGNSTNQFQGNFDGQGHTVSNLKIDGTGKSNQGFFGFTTNGSVSNLTIKNATVTGRLNVGVVAGTPYTSKYTNIKVTGHVEVEGMAYVGGVGGKNAYADWTDITVDVDETSFVKADSVENGTAYRTYVGGVIGFMGEGGHTLKNITSNINVEGSTCDVGGIVGIAHYQNNFENVSCAAKEIVVNSDDAEVGAIAGVWMDNSAGDVTMINCTASTSVKQVVTDENGNTTTTELVNAVNGAAYNGSTAGELLTATKTTDAYGAVALEITKVDGTGAKRDISESEVKKVAAADTGAASFIVGDYDVAGYEGSDVVMDANGKIVGGSFTATESADSTAFSAALSENVQQQTDGSIVNLVNLNVISVDDDHAGKADGTVVADGIIIGVNAFAKIQDAVNAAADGATIVVKGGTYADDVIFTAAEAGSVKELTIAAAAGEEVKFTGTFQIGSRPGNGTSLVWDKLLTIDGFTFAPETGEANASFDFHECHGGLTVKNSVFESVRDVDDFFLNVTSGKDRVVMDAMFENCSFTGGRIQPASQAQDDLIFNNCTFTDVKINLQIGKGAIFNDSTFNYYFANGELSYIIRVNSDQAIEISGSTFNIDAAEDFAVEYEKNGAPDFGMLWARQAGNASWVVEGCEVNYTAAALEIVSKEKDFAFIYNASTDKNKALERITVIDMTSENSAEELAAILGSSSGMVNVISDGKKTVYADGVALPMDKIVVDATKTAGEVFEVDGVSYMIGINAFTTLAEAAEKAADGTLIDISGATVSTATFVNGGTVTLTGNADLDWSKGWFFIGRGEDGALDSTVIIKDAAIGSTSDNATYGFHVSNAEKDSSSKADGTLIIDKSAVVTDYLINKNVVDVIGDGDFNDGEVDFYVKNGFYVAGRNSNETVDGIAHTACLNITNGAYVKIGNENGMGIGAHSREEGNADGKGVLNITDSKFESTQYLNCNAHGIINVTDGELVVAGTLKDDGKLHLVNSRVDAGNITGTNGQFYINGVSEVNAATVGDGKLKLRFGQSFNDSGNTRPGTANTVAYNVKKSNVLFFNLFDTDLTVGESDSEFVYCSSLSMISNSTLKFADDVENKVLTFTAKDSGWLCLDGKVEFNAGTYNINGGLTIQDNAYQNGTTVKNGATLNIVATGTGNDKLNIYEDFTIEQGAVVDFTGRSGMGHTLIGYHGAEDDYCDGTVFTVEGIYRQHGLNVVIYGANPDANPAIESSTLNVENGGLFEIDGSITNGGTINVYGGTLNADTVTNNGTLTITDSLVNIAGKLSNVEDVAAAVQVSGSTLKINKLDNDVAMFLSGENTIQVEDATGSGYAIRANDGVILNDSYIKATDNLTFRMLGSATINGGFAGAYLQGHSGGVGGTVTIDGLVDMSYGVEFSNNYTLNGGKIKLSGGNADGKVWGCVFQSGSYTIKTDIEVIGGGATAPIHFTDATADVYSTISQSSSGGEVIYLGGSTVNLKSGGRLESEAGIYVNSGSVLNISVGGTIVANNLVINDGTVVLDASGFTSGVKKVIDLKSGSSLENKITVNNLGEGVNVVYGSDGDVTLVNVDQSEVLINTGYTSQDAVDVALGENFKTYGGNAFESIASAVANTKTNNPLKLLFTGSETVASTGIVYVTADTDPNVAPHSVGNFDGRDVTISGINNSAERLWVDLNDTATDDTVAASKLTFDNAKLNVSKLKASYNSVININNSELNAEYIQSSNLYGKGNGIINVTGSKLIGFNQTSALGGAVISLSDSELESGSYNRIEQGSLNVLNGSKYTFSVLSIAKGGTLNVTDSVAASKEMLSAADVANVQVFKNNPNKHVIVKVGYDLENNESAGTLNLTGSEFTLTKAQYEENGEIKYTGDAQFIVGAQSTVNVTNSKFTADTVTNSGAFNVSGDSQLTIGTLTGAVKVTDAVLTDSVIGGGKGDVHTYGNVIVENGTFLNAEGSSRTGLTVMGGTTGLKGDVSTLVLGTDHARGTGVEKVLVISDGADVSVGLTGEDGSELKVGYLYARNDAEIIIEDGGKLNLNGQLSNRGTVTLKGEMEVAGVNGVGPIHLAGAGDPDEYGTMIIDGGELTDRKTSHQNANYLYTNTTMEIGHGGDQTSEVKVINGGKINTTNSYWNIYSDGVFKIQDSSVSIVAPTNNPGVGVTWEPQEFVMTNAGTIEISDASLAVDSLTNSGTITLNDTDSVTVQSLTSDHGVINLTNSTLTVEGVVALGGIDGDTIDFSAMLYQNFVISGTSMIKAETITGFLNISIDVAGIGSDVVSYKIIDTEYASDEFAYVAGYDDTSEWAIVEANGDFFMTKGDQSVLYVNSAYANDEDGIVEDGKIVGYNAFANLDDAFKVNNAETIVLKSSGLALNGNADYNDSFSSAKKADFTLTADEAVTVTFNGNNQLVGNVVLGENVDVILKGIDGKAAGLLLGSKDDTNAAGNTYQINGSIVNDGIAHFYVRNHKETVDVNGEIKILHSGNNQIYNKGTMNVTGTGKNYGVDDYQVTADFINVNGVVDANGVRKGGELNLVDTAANFTTFRLGNGDDETCSTVNVNNSFLKVGGFISENSSAQIKLTGSTLNYSNVPVNVGYGNAVIGLGTDVSMTLDNSTVDAAALLSYGAISAVNGSKLDIETFTNNGTVSINDATFTGNVLTVAEDAAFNAVDSYVDLSGNSSANYGEMSISGGSFKASRKVYNYGTIEFTNANVSLNSIDMSGSGVSGKVVIVDSCVNMSSSFAMNKSASEVYVDNSVLNCTQFQMGFGGGEYATGTGKVTIVNGSVVTMSNTPSASYNCNQTITIDATSRMVADGINYYSENGKYTITIDISNYAGGTNKIIDVNRYSGDMANISIRGTLPTNAQLIYGADGDVIITDTELSVVYANTAWTDKSFGDTIQVADGNELIYGITAFKSLTEAISSGIPVVLQSDVSESIENFYSGAAITTDKVGGVTIDNTYDDYYIGIGKLDLGANVTLKGEDIYFNDRGSVSTIAGTVSADSVMYVSGQPYEGSENVNVKVNVTETGKFTSGGVVIIRYNGYADSGVYVVGDGSKTEASYRSADYTGLYSGTLSIKDAKAEVGYMLLKNSYDAAGSSYAGASLVLDNALFVSNGQFSIDSNAALNATNGSEISVAGFMDVASGSQVSLTGSTVTVNNSVSNAGTFEMDFTSTLAFVSLTNSGTFTIDLSQYNGGAFKVLDSINNNYTVEMYQALLGNAYDNRFIVVGGDLFIADFADSEVYVNNNSYSGNVGDVTADGKIIGVNAFATVDDAVAAGAQSVTVSGGEYGKTGFDGVKVTIGNVTYSGAVYGGNCDENAVVSETIDLTISGGELQSAVYGGSRVHGGTSCTSGGICAVAGDVNVKVTSGSVQNVFVGGDLVTQALMFVREGDINVNISGGEFNDRVYGGITVHVSANESCMAQLVGNINMTISGGDFNDRVYGGNLAGKYERGDKLTITGNISVALDVSSNSVSFAEHLVLGSSGTSAVHGNTKLTLTGLGSNLTFADNSVIVGGSGDSYYLVEGGNRTPVSFVEGTKEFAFNAFTGALNAQIKIFDTMSFAGNSEVNFADSAINLDEISNWNFESGSLITGAANAISFNGDTINLNGSWEAGAAFELGNIDAFGDYNAWNDVTVYYGGSAVNYQFEEKENKLVITKLA